MEASKAGRTSYLEEEKEHIESLKSEDKPVAIPGQGSKSTLFPKSLFFKVHGNLVKKERQLAFETFTQSKTASILFCTDVASRGLDIKDVSQIIQYDPPADSKDYVHRIGRTARLGREGQATLFLMPSEIEYLDLLNQQYHCNIQETDPASILECIPRDKRSILKGRKAYEVAATGLQMEFERFVLSDEDVRLISLNLILT
jgi:ATP-dependent RNA helicase DDX31/DBP7